ncbi:PE-PGRS family protein [Mycobacterium tuberculosis]|nr:PE-PGRS family protein [Mycobacterium tuberculosis]
MAFWGVSVALVVRAVSAAWLASAGPVVPRASSSAPAERPVTPVSAGPAEMAFWGVSVALVVRAVSAAWLASAGPVVPRASSSAPEARRVPLGLAAPAARVGLAVPERPAPTPPPAQV